MGVLGRLHVQVDERATPAAQGRPTDLMTVHVYENWGLIGSYPAGTLYMCRAKAEELARRVNQGER